MAEDDKETKKDPRDPRVVTDYQGNSQKNKAVGRTEKKAEKKIEPVVLKGEVKLQQKSKGSWFRNAWNLLDIPGVFRHVYHEVAIPAAQNMFYDVTVGAIDRVTYRGRGGRRYPGPGPGQGSMIRYGGQVNRLGADPRSSIVSSASTRTTVTPRGARRNAPDGVFDTRQEAEDVLEGLNDIISQYDVASVGDLYELCGRPQDANPVDYKWGWVGVVDAPITPMRDGFLIEFPPVGALDQQ